MSFTKQIIAFLFPDVNFHKYVLLKTRAFHFVFLTTTKFLQNYLYQGIFDYNSLTLEYRLM